MKKSLLLVFSLFFTYLAHSQTYFNEWINYSQSYYKIPVVKDGLYKIDSLKLAKAGIPIGTIAPGNLQLFHKGQELYIQVSGDSDGVFNGTDYIMFYAEKNTCKDDSTLFYYGTFLANPYYSLINDTSAVFLTWNSSLSNRRMTLETDTAFSGYTQAPYFVKEDIQAFNLNYHAGPQNSIGATDPRYAHGEGLFQDEFDLGESRTYSFNTSALYSVGATVNASIVHSGMSNPYYAPDHTAKIQYLDNTSTYQDLATYSYDGYKTFKNDFAIDPLNVGSSFALRLNDENNVNYDPNATVMGVHYAKLVFQSTFNLLGTTKQTMYLPDITVGAKSFLSISNFNNLSTSPILLDLTNHKLITVKQVGANFNALVPNSGGNKTCYLSSTANVDTVLNIMPVNGNGSFVDYTLSNDDSVYIIVTHKKLMSSAGQYANYRRSTAGGSFNVLVADVQDLYDQFGYGVNRHGLSLKHFSKFLIANYITKPSYLLLLGKSVHAKDALSSVSGAAKNIVPSFGYPASDNLITQGLINPSSLAPEIPTGRVSATSDAVVMDYLNKVILFESQPTGQAWQKSALHFIGGISNYEQSIFNNYMNVNKATFEDTLIGGRVFTFKKTSTAPIAINTNDSIKQVIEAGVSLITFFGHGSVTGFEQNIDEPYNYNNSPRFPLLISNSCYTGDIHTDVSYSTSEKFVLAQDHGTIGFLASVSTGVSYALQIYTDEYYKNLSYKNYGGSYGTSVQNVVRYIEQIPSSINDSVVKITCLEMTLHGDPAVRPRTSELPDYELTNSDVTIDTDSQIDSINIKIDFRNLGIAINDTLKVYVERTLPSGVIEPYFRSVEAPYNATSLNFNIAKNVLNGVGLNKFYVKVDHFNEVIESNEFNNATIGQISAFVDGGDIMPVYPYKYAVIPTTTSVILKASTADPLAASQTYRFQVDTSDAFIAPFINTTITSVGGVLQLPVTLANGDSAVYFWRVGKDNSNVNAINWRESSFQSIINKSGWSQAHFHQFKNDKFEFVSYNKPIRKFEFKNNTRTVFCRNGYVGDPSPPYLHFSENSYYFDNGQQNYWTCGNGVGWSFAIFDSISGIPVVADTAVVAPWNWTWLSQYNSCVCTNQKRTIFDFGLYNQCGDNSQLTGYNPINMITYQQRMADFLDSVPNGSYVLAYSHNNDSAHAFSPSLLNAFTKIGSDSIQFKKDTCQMIIFGLKKPFSHTNAHEVMGENLLDIITLTDTFSTKWDNGFIESEIIGPAAQWRSLHWRFKSDESPSTDSIYIKVFGIRANGVKDTVALAIFLRDSLDVLDLQNYVNVATYPYIQLVAYESDYTNRTAPQLNRWQVLFDEVPEAALHTASGYSLNKPVIAEGDNIIITLPIKNISNTAFTDSLVVTYWLEDANGVEHPLPDKLKYKPFMPNDLILDTIVFNTLGYKGANAIWVDVNPLAHPKYQSEQFHFNNIIRIPFDVSGDYINPLLDVTFDGIHILNGDIISPTPGIVVTLKDENKFLALNDTADFTVYLKYPGTSVEKRIYFSEGLIFTPAQLPNNSCKIEFNPAKLADGKYDLRVQARDRSSNESGATDYKIQFEVINHSTITEVLNYPNPFSTSTKFVFTLTGSEIPETFKIQIMTITGKVVREINKDEIGNIHIGRNITEFAWNGKDEFGDQLANGVYLYRVQTRLNGETIEKKETAADEYFKKGWGKLVIMR